MASLVVLKRRRSSAIKSARGAMLHPSDKLYGYRQLDDTELTDALAASRIVNLVGSRQVGKTTLVRDLFHGGKFITLDNEALLAAIEADPQGQLESLTSDLGNAPLIIDQAQRSKPLSLSIKRIVDANRRKGQFVLTGSSNVFTSAEIADSLAGRMRTLQLWPLSAAEITRSKPQHILDWAIQKEPKLTQLENPAALLRSDYIDLVLTGGYLMYWNACP